MFRAVALLLLLSSANAGADGPWGVALGIGPAFERVTAPATADGGFTLGASAKLDTTVRFLDTPAVGAGLGLHLGIAYVRSREYGPGGEAGILDVTSVPFELGLGTQIVIADRVRVAPWGGFVYLNGGQLSAGGVELGFDIAARGAERMSAVANYTRAGHGGDSFDSVGAGVAYRYW